MAEEEEEMDEEGEEGKEGEEGGNEEEASTARVDEPGPSLTQLTLAENARYVAEKFDSLFALTDKIQDNMADMEKRLRTEFDGKIKEHHDAAILRIEALDKLTTEHGLKLNELFSRQNQQAVQLDDLQNQVGIIFFRMH